MHTSSPYSEFVSQASLSADAIKASVADNCRFDERTSDQRWEAFEALLPAPSSIAWEDWTKAYRLYLERMCNVPSTSVPDTFLDANRNAWLEKLSENQSLVRMEMLIEPLQSSTLKFHELKALVQSEGDDAGHVVRFFLEAWNQRRDARPTYAAFADEVQAELDQDDWPHTLRDRLGLGHYIGTPNDPLPIAVMRYSLQEVLAAQTSAIGSAVSLPTVLDGGMHEFFFPVPRDHPYGATVHLAPSLGATLTAEVVHCRIDYQEHHIYRLGEISRRTEVDDARLRQVRDRHLYALREVTGRTDFGDALEGRT